MKWLKHITAPLALLLAVMIGLSGGATAVFSQEPAANNTVYLPLVIGQATSNTTNELVNRVSKADQTRAIEFWTPERMRAAQPLDAPVLTAEQVEEARTATLQDTMDEPVTFLSGAPAAAAGTPGTAAVDSFPPFTGYRINPELYTAYPWSTIGRIFFTIPGFDLVYSCTAASVNDGADGANGGDVIITSARCIYTHEVAAFNENVIFVPGYFDGNAPNGAYPVEVEFVPREWAGPEPNFAYNFGSAIVADDVFTGDTLANRAGYLGFRFGIDFTQHFHAFSYPTNISQAQFMYVCAGSTARFFRHIFGPASIGIGCDAETIDSGRGGPWLVNYAPFLDGPVNLINGVGSFKTEENDLFSPYFGQRALDHLSNTQNFPREPTTRRP